MPPQKQSIENDKQKKTRHRHSPAQITALNDLYDRDEHPSLLSRTTLAEQIGLETKTVNAWFVNKRASIKKRGLRASNANNVNNTSSTNSNNGLSVQQHPPQPVELPPISTLMTAVPLSPESHHPDLEDQVEDDYHSHDSRPHSTLSSAPLSNDNVSLLPNQHSNEDTAEQSHYFPETNTTLRRMRMRPSERQSAELRELFMATAHPTKEQREHLAAKIGMPYQTVTNWFQNQRSHGKRRQEEQDQDSKSSVSSSRSTKQEESGPISLPPPSNHPSLGLALPPPSSHPSLGLGPPSTKPRASSSSPSASSSSRRSSTRRSSTPYNTLAIVSRRPRRSRPETYQLEALKALYKRTSMPTIEQRSALALEIDMDVGKVTNWFRNLRQTARKRARQNDDDDYDDQRDNQTDFGSASRSGSPFDSVSSHGDRYFGQDEDGDSFMQSDESDEEYEEVVTPPQVPSPSPPPMANKSLEVDAIALGKIAADIEKATASVRFPAINYEDALLLLSFRKQAVH